MPAYVYFVTPADNKRKGQRFWQEPWHGIIVQLGGVSKWRATSIGVSPIEMIEHDLVRLDEWRIGISEIGGASQDPPTAHVRTVIGWQIQKLQYP
jgi:hypothetical protein